MKGAQGTLFDERLDGPIRSKATSDALPRRYSKADWERLYPDVLMELCDDGQDELELVGGEGCGNDYSWSKHSVYDLHLGYLRDQLSVFEDERASSKHITEVLVWILLPYAPPGESADYLSFQYCAELVGAQYGASAIEFRYSVIGKFAPWLTKVLYRMETRGDLIN